MPQKTYMYDTQWNQLINAIGAGDSSAVVTALNTIKNSLDNITNAISNQTITLDFSNINSDNVSNLSDVTGSSVSTAFNTLNSKLNNLYTLVTSGIKTGKGLSVRYYKYGKFAVISCITSLDTPVVYDEILVSGLPKPVIIEDSYINCYQGSTIYLTHNGDLRTIYPLSQGTRVIFTYMYLTEEDNLDV